ncbi:hypothetical protein MPTK1_2g15510 [Marchantia polymorpha subsp. ruderalis]|uniref:Uncharacterized protein n=1 Tax=Marchantia polymorpha TaxID=3197 RepID=A0A2R6WK48_MARPO|nr:hypothetical protein MARPO_0082s0048 [Marchantia polymorpha]BBN02453.1 hypothetical protein Mp_2g15510 [Marchantia polymorpha subsp. ruderalis]|eukprot:PTQ34201.1 hypothetical protein MARPO_0082s0048 [Marchantia polymorpha]
MATAGQAELNQRKGFVQEGQYVNDGIPQGYPQSHPPQGAYTTGKPGEGPPYVQGQNVDELGRKKTRGAKLAACLVACWACTWCCHGPCCCGL